MRVTSSSAQSISIRITQVIALSAVIAMAACQDTTAPEAVKTMAPGSLSLTQNGPTDELTNLSSSLDDMTGWSLAGFADQQGKANIVGILNGLKGHLASGKIDACQQDVTDARTWFNALSQNDQIEVGGVGVTLDLIQAALDKASQ